MIQLIQNLNINSVNNSSVYSVIISDSSSSGSPGYDGPTNRFYSIGSDGPNDLTPEQFDGAVQAFANYIAENVQSHNIYGISKASVAETNL